MNSSGLRKSATDIADLLIDSAQTLPAPRDYRDPLKAAKVKLMSFAKRAMRSRGPHTDHFLQRHIEIDNADWRMFPPVLYIVPRQSAAETKNEFRANIHKLLYSRSWSVPVPSTANTCQLACFWHERTAWAPWVLLLGGIYELSVLEAQLIACDCKFRGCFASATEHLLLAVLHDIGGRSLKILFSGQSLQKLLDTLAAMMQVVGTVPESMDQWRATKAARSKKVLTFIVSGDRVKDLWRAVQGTEEVYRYFEELMAQPPFRTQ